MIPYNIFNLLFCVVAPRGYVLETAHKLLSSSKRKGYQYTRVVCLQTYTTLKTALFWAIAQRVVVISYRRSGTTYGSVFKVAGISESICCPETSVKNYHYTLRNSSEESSSHLLRGGSLKSRITTLYSTSSFTQHHWNYQSKSREKDLMPRMCVEKPLSLMCKFTLYFVIFALSAQLLNC